MTAHTDALRESEAALDEVIAERDEAEEWADRLAYAIAPESEIGEHTSANNPWQNALDALPGLLATERARGREEAVEPVLRILDETVREAEGHLAADDPEPCEDGGHDCHAAARFALAHRIRRALADPETVTRPSGVVVTRSRATEPFDVEAVAS